jgi:hypothetical protein
MRVTFDTNTFDKVSRPSIYAKDADHAHMIEIHEALKRGEIQGFICDTALTLEGIRTDDRSASIRRDNHTPFNQAGVRRHHFNHGDAGTAGAPTRAPEAGKAI